MFVTCYFLQRRSRIPDHIYQRLKNLLPSNITVMDQVGTTFRAVVEKHENKAYFSDGIGNILRHYNLEDGCNLTLWSCNEESYEIVTIKDLYMAKVKCPKPPKNYCNVNIHPETEIKNQTDDDDDVQYLGERTIDMYMEKEIGLEDYHLAKCIISLTKYHTVNNNMVSKNNIYVFVYLFISCL